MGLIGIVKEVINWIFLNYLEVIGALLGIIYVILATKQSIWCWYAGTINVLIYIFVFIEARLYGDMALQIFYLGMSIYGWYLWKYPKQENRRELEITRISKRTLINVVVITVISAWGFGYILTFTDTDVPRWDGVVTALGLIGTWMTARKYLENWLVWIVANTLCIGIYFYKELYPTVGFYAIITILAVAGYYKWKKELLKKQLPGLQ
jgi:nicotinamide mononucleotide transporter